MSQVYAHAHAHAALSAEPEYAVYIYHHPENRLEGQNDWEMRTRTTSLQDALDEARCLHESRGYRMVEVKKRALNQRTARVQDQTFKVFDCQSDEQGPSAKIALGAAFSAAAAFMASLLLN